MRRLHAATLLAAPLLALSLTAAARAEAPVFDPEAVRAHVAAHLAAYKVPAVVQVVTQALPRNPAGKLLKRQLRSAFVDGQLS